jgi:multicomponent K+:H+ antiporter subunit A
VKREPETLLITLMVLAFVGSSLAVLFRGKARNVAAYLAGVVTLLALALVIATYPRVVDGGVVQYQAARIPELGLEFNIRMDGFAWLMAALITGIGFLVVLYARYFSPLANTCTRKAL